MPAAILSTPPPQYISPSSRARNMTPTCRAAHYSTPPRFSADLSSYDSPILTPSPLRQRPFAPPVHDPDQDDIFLQSPFKSPPPVHHLYPQRVHKKPVPIDDDDGSIFLSPSSATTSPFFPPQTSQTLRTPVKEELRSNSRSVLRSKPLNAREEVASASTVPHTSVGTKRKSLAQSGRFSIPLRHSASTPLSISAQKVDPASGVAFHRLAPLPALRFGMRTPHTKAETEACLKGQAETMTRLRIRDMENSDEDWGAIEDDDSACEAEERVDLTKKPLSNKLPQLPRRSKNQLQSPRKSLPLRAVPQKGSTLDEVTEAISPGGHILKRRARSRPVSLELLESVNQTPLLSASSHHVASNAKKTQPSPFKSPPVAFPLVSRNQTSAKHGAPPSASDTPVARRRVTGNSGSHPLLQANEPSVTLRQPMTRLASNSSASLFFGPSIPQISNKTRSRTASNVSPPSEPHTNAHTSTSNRHSYSGAATETIATLPWRSTLAVSSPNSSPLSQPFGHPDDEDDIFFEPCGPPESSFVFNVTAGTPSPRSKGQRDMLPLKYKPRDSGVALSDDEDASASNSLSAVPHTSTSASSLNSDIGDDLITPGGIPSPHSGWPVPFVVSASDDDLRKSGGIDIDTFIFRTLAAGKKPSAEESKKPPGTPVKKIKNAHLGGNRPWQSAVASKVGFNFGGLDLGVAPGGKMKNGPRKSLPAAFPALGVRKVMNLHGSDDDEDEENSPSTRKEMSKYEGLGLGRPPISCGPAGPVERTRWLMRRSSSGAFSNGSDTSLTTPTRRSKDWPILSRVPTHMSPNSIGQLRLPSDKQGSRTSSNSSMISLNSPTLSRRQAGSASQRLPISSLQHMVPAANDKPGRFDKEFVEIDQIGSGEFGKVLKVRSKNGSSSSVSAVKRSKPFEGPRHRLRLREEVDVLQHLCQAAAAEGGSHPNVLAYIDSWEEDEMLFIQTELCELGNLGRFLWEYGKTFPRLDEARVWKVFVDLSNGLRFIHESGVIHLDLKPANIFLTQEGRFKIGDFGMASLWPRASGGSPLGVSLGGFEREGDKVYLAPEVLQGTYSKAADIFSLGMTMLETATNIVVPDQGDGWHRLRQEDFGQVDLDGSPELFDLIKRMMRTDPTERVDIQRVHSHSVIRRARSVMEGLYTEARVAGRSVFGASPLGGVPDTFLEEILGRRATVPQDDDDDDDDIAMDLSP